MLMLPHLGELWIYNLGCTHRIGELGGPKEQIVTTKTKDFFYLAMLWQKESREGCRKLHLQLRIYILQQM
jgi:hypothetical protein